MACQEPGQPEALVTMPVSARTAEAKTQGTVYEAVYQKA